MANMDTKMFDRDILMGMLDQECLGALGTSAAVIGAHKVGKTHLLDYICDRPNTGQENLFCIVDRHLLRASCRADESLSDHVFLRFFLAALLTQVNDLIEIHRAESERWQVAIKQAELLAEQKKQNNEPATYEDQLSDIEALKQKVSELEVLEKVSKKIERLTEQPSPISIYEVTSVIDNLQKIRKRIILVIDEFNQLLKEKGLSYDLFSFLRGANNRRKIIALVTSPIDLMDPSLHDDMSPGREDLFNHFHPKILYPFDTAEANRFLDWLKPAPALTENERTYIIKLGGGSPYFLKESLQYFNAYGRPATDEARQDFERKFLAPTLENPFRQIWGRCSPDARTIMSQLAAGETIDETHPAFLFLETAGYLIRTKSGVSLFSSLFSDFAKRQSSKLPSISKSALAVEEVGWQLAKGVSVKAELLYTTIPSALFYVSPKHAELVQFEIKNTTSETKQIRLECQVARYGTGPETRIVKVPPGSKTEIMSVTLDSDAVDLLEKAVPATVRFEALLTDSDQRSPLTETKQVRFLPKNNFLMARYDPSQKTTRKLIDFTWLITAWITDDEKTLNGILQKAAELDPLMGYQVPKGPEGAGAIQKKVAALYEALRSRGLQYHNHTLVFHKAEKEFVQRVRLPREILAHNAANCLELSVLFASLLGFNDLDPAILLTPGHALVGWRDRKGEEFEWNFLEITWIAKNATFAEAFAEGQEKYLQAQQRLGANMDSQLDPDDFAVLLDVRRILEEYGINPL
jgi:hypothetical protein